MALAETPAAPAASAAPAPPAASGHPKQHNLHAARQAYYDRISNYDMVPLSEKLREFLA